MDSFKDEQLKLDLAECGLPCILQHGNRLYIINEASEIADYFFRYIKANYSHFENIFNVGEVLPVDPDIEVIKTLEDPKWQAYISIEENRFKRETKHKAFADNFMQKLKNLSLDNSYFIAKNTKYFVSRLNLFSSMFEPSSSMFESSLDEIFLKPISSLKNLPEFTVTFKETERK